MDAPTTPPPPPPPGPAPVPGVLTYRRSQFATQLPLDRRYRPSHSWLAERPGGVWRVGFTKFATRMLGETVDHAWQVEPGARVQPGQVLGWIEGFKAISDLFCLVDGVFVGGNPALKETPDLINKDCFGAGWLYEVRGTPDAQGLDAQAYADLLDRTIDQLRERQPAEPPPTA